MKYRKMVAFGLTAAMAAGMTSGMTMTGFAEEDKPTIRWVSQGVGETGGGRTYRPDSGEV